MSSFARAAFTMMLLCAALPPSTVAQNPPVHQSIFTTVDPCVPLDSAQFQHQLSIELAPTFDVSSDPSQCVASVSLTCVGSGVQLQIDDAVTRKSLKRVVDLRRVAASSRSRLMALTVTELLTASWLEIRLFGESAVEPVAPQPPPAAVQTASRLVQRRLPAAAPAGQAELGRLQLGLTFDVALFTSAPRPIPCLSLRMAYAIATGLVLQLGVQVGQVLLPGILEIGSQRDAVEVYLTTTSLLAGLGYQWHAGDFDLSLGVGARIGLAYMKGASAPTTAFSPDSTYVAWGGPGVVVGVDYRAAPHVRILLGLEVGPVVRRAVAVAGGADRPVVQLRDVWGNLHIGLGWSN